MKKLIILLSAGGLLLLSSCSNEKKEGGLSETTKKNLEASRAIGKAVITNDLSLIDSVVAADFVDHSEHGEMNRDSLKAMTTLMHKTNTNMKSETLKELADDDYVMAWMRFTGNHDGSMMAPGPYDMSAIQLTRFKDGKAVEHWQFMEPRIMMKMMGGQKPPADTTAKKDSTAK